MGTLGLDIPVKLNIWAAVFIIVLGTKLEGKLKLNRKPGLLLTLTVKRLKIHFLLCI